jgi:uncharacterized protein
MLRRGAPRNDAVTISRRAMAFPSALCESYGSDSSSARGRCAAMERAVMAMTMSGEYELPVPREVVWEKLNDPETLKAAIPGSEELQKVSDTEFQAVVVTKIGPVKAKFKGKVTLSDLDPPNGYTISGEGSGGAAGFAKGSAVVHLIEDGGATNLNYEVKAQIGGKLAQLGSRLIDATSKKLATEFFEKFGEAVAPPPETPESADAEAPEKKKGWFRKLVKK